MTEAKQPSNIFKEPTKLTFLNNISLEKNEKVELKNIIKECVKGFSLKFI